MEQKKVLQAFEELIYEISLWVILLPKTFAKIVFNPGWIHRYVAAELDRDSSERWDKYLSPVLFWIFTSVVPLLLLMNALASKNLGIQFVDKFLALPLENKLLAVSIFLLWWPVGFSAGIMRFQRQPIGRISFQRVFYTQCFCASPGIAGLILTYSAILHMIAPITAAVGLALFYWAWYAEIRVIRQELSLGLLKSVGVFGLLLFTSMLLMMVLEVVVLVGVVTLTGK